jgi:hypothetical protein
MYVPLVRRAKSLVPHFLQNTRSRAGEDRCTPVGPSTATACWSNSALAKNGDESALWQLRQWHTLTFRGSPLVLKRTAPHIHRPSRIIEKDSKKRCPCDVNYEHELLN